MNAVYAAGSRSNDSTYCLLLSTSFVHLPCVLMSSMLAFDPRGTGSAHTSTSAWPALGEMKNCTVLNDDCLHLCT